jgi:hypothetical protein
MISSGILIWWSSLCVVSLLNVSAWIASIVALKRRRLHLSPGIYASRRLLLIFSAAYVFGCAYRSVFLTFDVPRIGVFDLWLSSVIVGRSVATVAELCFVAQWVLVLREISIVSNGRLGRAAPWAIVPMIVSAEICSWYAVLTTSNLGHVAENSLWGLSASLLLASLLETWPRCDLTLRRWLAVLCVTGMAYVAFIFLVDVPMYWSRWLADESSGREYLTLAQGLADVSERWFVSYQWEIWKNEVAWMSLYFSVAVWLSIALIHFPAPKNHIADRAP